MLRGSTCFSWGERLGSLRLRLMFLVAVLSLPLLAVTQWEHEQAIRDRLVEAAAGLAGLAGDAAAEKAALLGQTQTLLSAIAHLPTLRQDQPAACETALREIHQRNPWHISLGVFSPDGMPICTTVASDQSISIADQGYFRLAIAQRQFVLSELLVGRVRWEPVVVAAEPVLDAAGTVRFVIVAGIDLIRLGGLMQRHLAGDADLVLLADASGTVLAGQPDALDMVGRSLRSSRLEVALAGDRRGDARANWPDGKARVFGFAAVPGTDAILVVGREEAAILAPLAALRRTVLLLLGGTLLAAMLTALAAGHWLLVRPVARMSEAVRRIGRAEDTAAALSTTPNGSPSGAPVDPLGGEAAELAHEVNAMTRRIDDTRRTLLARNAELVTSAVDLARALDAAEAASAAKSRLVAAAGQELRTPLDGILGHLQSLTKDAALTWSQRQRLELIAAESRDLLVITGKLLDLSAIEAGRARLTSAPLRLMGLAADCAALIRPMAEAKGLAFTLELVHPLPGWISSDVQRLRQVLLDLLGHAVRSTAHGGVTLRIGAGRGGGMPPHRQDGSTAASPSPAGELALVRFEIADTGLGMTAAERAHLFQDFIRPPGAGSSEGTGLGLAISARLVTLMGGYLQYDSMPEMGNCFWFELALPAAAAPPGPMAPDMVSAADGRAEGMAGLGLSPAARAWERQSPRQGQRPMMAGSVSAT